MGYLHWLQLLFVALKLTNYIDWSWWFVLGPTILWFAFFFYGVWYATTPQGRWEAIMRNIDNSGKGR